MSRIGVANITMQVLHEGNLKLVLYGCALIGTCIIIIRSIGAVQSVQMTCRSWYNYFEFASTRGTSNNRGRVVPNTYGWFFEAGDWPKHASTWRLYMWGMIDETPSYFCCLFPEWFSLDMENFSFRFYQSANSLFISNSSLWGLTVWLPV